MWADLFPLTRVRRHIQQMDYIVFITFHNSDPSNILNKSENATPELFAIYKQNFANQECNGKCI